MEGPGSRSTRGMPSGLSTQQLQQHTKRQQQQQQQQQQYDGSNFCPASPLFPHFPPPPEYPPPGSRQFRYPDDPDCIEICIEPDPDEGKCGTKGKPKAKPRTKVNYAKNAHTMGHAAAERSSWNRSNIAVTMERYEPSTSARSPIHSPHQQSPYHHPQQQQQHHHDYSYAYYEPGMPMRHAPPPSDPGPSRPPPPNSMRALLNTASRKNSPNNRNRYGTQENIYEEIANDPRMRIMSAGSSMVSLNQSMVEEEFRRIQSRHRRILGELNLSVEAMLMPESPPQNSPVREVVDPTPDTLELLNSVGPTDELLSPVSTSAVNNGDMDSGFSGSSSSASYVGSLRYHRPTGSNGGGNGGGGNCINGGGSQTRSSTPGGGNNSSYSGSIRSSQRSNDDGGITSASRSFNSVYDKSSSLTNKKSSEDEKQKPSFWSRKGWRKIPGFSSTTSVNKAGISVTNTNAYWGYPEEEIKRDEEPTKSVLLDQFLLEFVKFRLGSKAKRCPRKNNEINNV